MYRMHKRTVVCRYCYKSGHNRRTCPVIKQSAAEGNVYAISIQKRYQNQEVTRRCSYCKSKDHNKKTCEKLSEDFVKICFANQTYRKEIADKFVELGIGKGAILSYNECLYLVTNIFWDEILVQKTNRDCIETYGMNNSGLSFSVYDILNMCKIHRRAQPENIAVNNTKEWVSGTSNIKEVFPYID